MILWPMWSGLGVLVFRCLIEFRDHDRRVFDDGFLDDLIDGAFGFVAYVSQSPHVEV